MDFQQVKYTRFISPTSCYSGLRRLSRENGDGNLATESDSLRFSTSKQHEISGHSLPKPASDEIPCVGYDWCDDQQVFVLLQNNSIDDDFTIWNNTHDSVLSMIEPSVGASSLPRRQSITEASVVSEAATAATSATVPVTTTTAEEDNDIRHTSHLIWHNGGTSCGRVALPFRLLSPTFSRIDDDSYLVWAGCADDSELRCFQLVDKLHIQSVSLEALEAFTSPIMSIEATCESLGAADNDDGQTTTLAVGCQDGTVRLLTFSCRIADDETIELSSIHSHTVIVDGPILSLHLTTQRVLVGSMCGYVCQLQRGESPSSCWSSSSMSSGGDNVIECPHWQEPRMIVKDFLWDARYEADDPVLAVHFWNNRVLLGTYSGLVQIYVAMARTGDTDEDDETSENETSYAVEWCVRLSHAIHAITDYEDQVVVTTKKSLHVYQAKPKSPYSASRAKERLGKMLGWKKIE